MSKVLFDSLSWMDVNASDYIDEYLECSGRDRDEFKTEDDLLEAVTEWLQSNTEWEWDDFKEQCSHEVSNHCLVTGYFMSWMGPQAGGKIYKDLETAVQDILMDGDSHPVFSIDDDGNLVLDETHHDAPCSGNHYEFRILTAKGEKYYNNHMYDDRRTLHEALKKEGRTRKVNIKIFGI